MSRDIEAVAADSAKALAATQQESAKAIEQLVATGGQSWIAVTHYPALAALSRAMVQAGIAPKGMSEQQALGVMAYGIELGLGPIGSLSSIAFVNGKPSMFGDGIAALLMRSGELADMPIEAIEGEGDARTATCILKRKGMKTPITRTFSVANAKAAGLWGKAGPWTTYPDRMLRWRAFGWAARDGFADILRGLWTREEAMDIPLNAEVGEIRTAPPMPTAAPVVETPMVAASPAPPAPQKGNGGKKRTPPPSKGGEWTEHHQKLNDMILFCAHDDKEAARRMCAQYTSFVASDGRKVSGVQSVRDMSLEWVLATLHKEGPGSLAADYEAAQREAKAGGVDPLEEEAAIEATKAVGDEVPW